MILSLTSWAKTSHSSKSHKNSIQKPVSSKSHAKSKSKSKSKSKKNKKAWQARGQQNISDDRTREIQAALIRENYMSGEPSGQMDSATKQALIKLQQENGWQTKIDPDARALIKLGLGPNHDNLLNPQTAAVASRQGTPDTAPAARQ
jgi:peptidoglycan hydrolase-like protein with peptidoglycan-binding domain